MAKKETGLFALGLGLLLLSSGEGDAEPDDPPDDPPNERPNAAFTYQVNGFTATLRGGNSSDPDGSIVSYRWTYAGQQIGTGDEIDMTFDSPGNYDITLTVTDDAGATDSVTRTVPVEGSTTPPPTNQGPTASFSVSTERRSDGVYIVVDGSSSSDPDGTIVSYEWELSYAPDATHLASRTGQTAEFKVPAVSDYYVSLTVEDDAGQLDQKLETVTVHNVEPLPDDPTFDRTIQICGKSPTSSATVQYNLSVSGGLREAEDSLNRNDDILSDGKTAVGQVIGGCDIYEFHGNIINFDWQGGDLDVFVDGQKKDPYTLPDADGPPKEPEWRNFHRDSENAPTIDIALYTTERLFDRRGRKGEKAAAICLRGALNRTVYNYNIYFNLPIQSPPDDQKDTALNWWRDQVNKTTNQPVVAKDANLLLSNKDGGGIASIGGYVGVKGMGRTNSVPEYRLSMRDDDAVHNDLHGMLHEVGHMLGIGHTNPGGIAHNDHAEKLWVRTPQVVGNPDVNQCGDEIPVREYDEEKHLNYWSNCSWMNFEIEGGGTEIRR